MTYIEERVESLEERLAAIEERLTPPSAEVPESVEEPKLWKAHICRHSPEWFSYTTEKKASWTKMPDELEFVEAAAYDQLVVELAEAHRECVKLEPVPVEANCPPPAEEEPRRYWANRYHYDSRSSMDWSHLHENVEHAKANVRVSAVIEGPVAFVRESDYERLKAEQAGWRDTIRDLSATLKLVEAERDVLRTERDVLLSFVEAFADVEISRWEEEYGVGYQKTLLDDAKACLKLAEAARRGE